MSEELNNTMNLNSISDQGSLKKRKRVGRGMGSGLGKTAGRGHKVKNQDQVEVSGLDLKAVKCHYK